MSPSDDPRGRDAVGDDLPSRESTIVLDREGRFWHDGEPVEHRGLARAFARWIQRRDDGRFVLDNGYDWCYLTVADTPYFVRAVHVGGDRVELELSDGSREPLSPGELYLRADDEALRTTVKGGDFEARFTRRAQLGLARLLDADDPWTIVVGGRRWPIRRRSREPSSGG